MRQKLVQGVYEITVTVILGIRDAVEAVLDAGRFFADIGLAISQAISRASKEWRD